MLSAALLLAPACARRDEAKAPSREEPVRRAVYLSLIARDFLGTCPAAAGRGEVAGEGVRYAELRRLAIEKGAGHAVWLGENDHDGLARHDDHDPCQAGEAPYRAALADYGRRLDALAAGAAAFRP
jgi:hypothetical protein